MKTELLKAGQTFRNYKSLCEALEIEVKKSSKSKMYQFKELSRFCKHSKQGQKITIEEVFDIPEEKVDLRGKSEGSRNNNNIYGDAIQLLLTDLLAKSEGRLIISRGRLLQRIGIVNSNYSELGEYIPKLSKYTEIQEEVVHDFYDTNNSNFRSQIENALKYLSNKRRIKYSTVTRVIEKETGTSRYATPDEDRIILDCEQDVLEEMGFKGGEIQARSSKHWKKYKRKVQKLLNQRTDLSHFYLAYDIIISEKYIENELKEMADLLLEKVVQKQYMDQLNQTVIENIIKNATKRHEKEVKNGWGTAKNKKVEARRSNTYIEDIKRLANLLIDKDMMRITDKVKEVKIEFKPVSLPQQLLDEIEGLLC